MLGHSRFVNLFTFLLFFASYVVAYPLENFPRDLTTNPEDVNGQTFSYIVVGGGTAGLAVAARLSENSSNTVLVIEAGSTHFDDPLITVPAFVGEVYGDPDYDWSYYTTPQINANNRSILFDRGKVLGGCSALNAMIWDRASSAEYSNLESLDNPGWGWSDMLPYFTKPENFTPASTAFADQWNLTYEASTRGFSGPIKTTFDDDIPQAEAPMEPAALSLGLSIVYEPMGGETLGTWRAESSVDPVTRTRSYSTTGYYLPNQNRTNLVVLTDAQVTKINWEGSVCSRWWFPLSSSCSLTASGVSFAVNGTTYTASAALEVILSAGDIGSPQLLELSGIGSSSILSQYGIETLVDLPGVGENLQDHIFVIMSYELQPGTQTLDPFFNNSTFVEEQEVLFEEIPASGAMTYTASGVTFLNLRDFIPSFESLLATAAIDIAATNRTLGQVNQQNLQLALLNQSTSSIVEILSEGLHLTPGSPAVGSSYISFLTLLQQPFSRGSVHIASANPLDYPAINPNYFDIDFDLEVLTSIAQFVRSTLTQTAPWADLIVSEAYPGTANVSTAAEWEAWIKSDFSSQGHTTGSCSMMPREMGGVVDSTLKVYGTTNVRVVDLSIIPQQFSGHPQSLVYAIAEKAAVTILAANS